MVKRRMGIMAVLLSLFLCLMPNGAFAVSTADAKVRIDTNKACTLTLSYRCDGTAISGEKIKLYQIAKVSSDAKYTFISPFTGCGLSLNEIQTNREWNVIRSTMDSYIVANKITPFKTAVTDGEGKVNFTGLQPGLYLASEVQGVRGDLTYIFDSALIALPGLNTDGFWQYQLSAAAKPEILPPIGPNEKLQFKVLKLWKGDKGDTDRPSSIEIEIFRNGISYETKVLSEENHWSYSWTAKDDGASWNVIERDIPEGYIMTIEERGKTFILTNTLTPDVPAISPVDPPKAEDPPQVDEPSQGEEPSKIVEGSDELLTGVPKTGDTSNILLYAVIMFVAGSLLIILGITEKRNRHE